MPRFVIVALLLTLIFLAVLTGLKTNPEQKQNIVVPSAMEISSDSIKDNSKIPSKFTCDGDNVNPDLKFDKLPGDTKSLTLIVDDPDAPLGVWDHWLVADINPDSLILENAIPERGIVGKNSFGKVEYGGPCPPSGTHHYYFRLYALDIKLDLPDGFSRVELEEAMKGHILEQAQIVGLYR